MIKLDNFAVYNFENAIRGMRNPLNSWEKSDSYSTHIENPETNNTAVFQFVIGEEDLRLAQSLVRAGSDHRKFLRQIFVSVDITAPLYWGKEYDTYKVGTVANSCSTMHTVHKKPFVLDDFSHERMTPFAEEHLEETITILNAHRKMYNDTGNKDFWDSMIQLLPSSYNQMRTCTLNYENILNIYFSRKNHKLAEWRSFCDWVLNLPLFAAFIGEKS